MNLPKILCFIITIAGVIASFLVYPTLPAAVPVHWNAFGEINGYGPSWVMAFLFPGIMAGLLLMLIVLPKIDVFRKNYAKFDKEYWLMALLLETFFLAFFAVTLLPNYGFKSNLTPFFTSSFAALFICLGLLMPRFKRNFFVGIRTPWTIANDTVWEKTHKLGGMAFVVAGLLSLLGLFFQKAAIFLFLGLVIFAGIVSVVYSYIVFRKHGKVQL